MSYLDPIKGATQNCQTCGKEFVQAQTTSFDEQPPRVTWSQDTSCYDCQQAALFGQLPVEVQHQVDGCIYAQRILQGMLLLKKTLAIGLTDANFLFHWRYRQLQTLTPNKMPLSNEAYWDGFIS